MTRLRSVETQIAQLLSERQTADKHNQALRAQLMKAQEKVTVKVHIIFFIMSSDFSVVVLNYVLKRLCCHLVFLQVQALDSTLQGLTQQNVRLKSDLRITQQERDALKQEVISLHKQVQNANEKVDASFSLLNLLHTEV